MPQSSRGVRRRFYDVHFGGESLERRDCPAVVSIAGPNAGPNEVTETGGTVTLLATLSEQQSRPVEVRYFTSGSATAGSDYGLFIGQRALPTQSGVFTFQPGVTQLPITVAVRNDTIRESNETFEMVLVFVRGHTIGHKSVAFTIADDDSYTASINGPAKVSARGQHVFTLQLSSPATRRETFLVTTEDRSATAPREYSPLRNHAVTLLPGETARTFAITTTAVNGLLHDKTFIVSARPRATDMPSVAPFAVTIEGATSLPSAPPGPPFSTATFTQDYGWGVVNASASVAKLLGRATAFAEEADSPISRGTIDWGIDAVRAPEVWAQGHRGGGIVVAVVDTGVDYTHPSLSSSIWVNRREIPNDGVDNDNNGFVDDVRGWDFFGNDNDPMDGDGIQSGHGTHVAGTIAARISSGGPSGIAPDAKIMAVRLSDNLSSDNYLASSILYAANNGANVINLSLRTSPSNAVIGAIRQATELGAIIVAAAGNSAGSTPSFPASLASLPGVISVGAVTQALTLAGFSHRAGVSPSLKHVVAPGVNVRSTVPAGFTDPTIPVQVTSSGTFADFQGTSMAAPHVAGVVALMLSALPNPRAPGVRDRVVNALVTTSQQPPASPSTTVVAASIQSVVVAATAQRRGQGGLITSAIPMAFQMAAHTPTVRPQAYGAQGERGSHSDAALAIAFRAMAASSDSAEPRGPTRLAGLRRLA